MSFRPMDSDKVRVTARLVAADHDHLVQLWEQRGVWLTKIRWVVPPVMLVSVGVGRALGFEFHSLPLLLIAAAILLYNGLILVIARSRRRKHEALHIGTRLTIVGMVADYASLLCLLHVTGGVSSPFLIFATFNVIIAAIQFSPQLAQRVATGASACLWLMLVAQLEGWITPLTVSYRGQALQPTDRSVFLLIVLALLTVTLFVAAGLASRIMRRFRARVGDLATVTTELEAAYDRLKTVLDERTRFMLEVAHNLRAPIGASLSMLDLVKEGYAGTVSREQLDPLERVERQLQGLNRTIGELLTIGKASDWSREIKDVVVDLHQVAARTRETFRDEAARKQIRFEVNTGDDLPLVDSGADLLDQVMENLVSNAIKYTPEHGEVEVRFTYAIPDAVRIIVRDTGIGIPGREQHELFREFFRASNAKALTREGTGLGLALVKTVVDRHRGKIRIESEAGAGTTVTIKLPTRRLGGPPRP